MTKPPHNQEQETHPDFCPECGKKTAADAKYCIACGKRLGTADPDSGGTEPGDTADRRMPVASSGTTARQAKPVVRVVPLLVWSAILFAVLLCLPHIQDGSLRTMATAGTMGAIATTFVLALIALAGRNASRAEGKTEKPRYRGLLITSAAGFFLLSLIALGAIVYLLTRPRPAPNPVIVDPNGPTVSPAVGFPTPVSGHEGENFGRVTPAPEHHDAVLSPGDSAKVRCGEGNGGTNVSFHDKGFGTTFAGNFNLGDQVDLSLDVKDGSGNPAGALVEWRLSRWGTLAIDGCNAVFTAPDSINTAFQVSAEVFASRVREATPVQNPGAGGGEGGPVMVSSGAHMSINIYNQANNTRRNNDNRNAGNFCDAGWTYNYSSRMCCPNNAPHYYNGNHGITPAGCYAACPYIGDCSDATTSY